MSCCGKPKRSSTHSPPRANTVMHETLLRIPGCKVKLMDQGEAMELGSGDFCLIRVSDGDVSLATIVKVGDQLQWPLTKDEPVVKVDAYDYLFSLPIKGDVPLSYGVTFSVDTSLRHLDSFLKQNSVFTTAPSPTKEGRIDWKDFAPAVDNYNNFLAKAIAGGTGHVVKGIFLCTNAYANQVHKGGETILIGAADNKNSTVTTTNKNTSSINRNLKRVRKLSKMTEKMSKAMLDVVGVASGSVMAPVMRSEAGKKFMSTVPGEILLASLDAVNKILDTAEAAEKQAMTATSGAVTKMVTDRYGESAGEATGDALATAGHCAGTAWNVFKIRKAINPASSVSSRVLKNAAKSAKP